MSEQDGTYSKRPDYIAYNVQPSRDGKGHWNRIGAAWEHQDGQGFKLRFGCVPLNGEMDLRKLRDERIQDYQEQQQAQAAQPEQTQEHASDAPDHGRTR